jgi:hypothetical protein
VCRGWLAVVVEHHVKPQVAWYLEIHLAVDVFQSLRRSHTVSRHSLWSIGVASVSRTVCFLEMEPLCWLSRIALSTIVQAFSLSACTYEVLASDKFVAVRCLPREKGAFPDGMDCQVFRWLAGPLFFYEWCRNRSTQQHCKFSVSQARYTRYLFE